MKTPLSHCVLVASILVFLPLVHADDTQSPPVAAESEEQIAAQKRLAVERAQEARRALQDEVVARYSSSADGRLTETDRRRHAHDLFVQKNDLNGDGKVDQHELKAMVARARQRKQAEQKTAPATPAPEKKGGEAK